MSTAAVGPSTPSSQAGFESKIPDRLKHTLYDDSRACLREFRKWAHPLGFMLLSTTYHGGSFRIQCERNQPHLGGCPVRFVMNSWGDAGKLKVKRIFDEYHNHPPEDPETFVPTRPRPRKRKKSSRILDTSSRAVARRKRPNEAAATCSRSSHAGSVVAATTELGAPHQRLGGSERSDQSSAPQIALSPGVLSAATLQAIRQLIDNANQGATVKSLPSQELTSEDTRRLSLGLRPASSNELTRDPPRPSETARVLRSEGSTPTSAPVRRLHIVRDADGHSTSSNTANRNHARRFAGSRTLLEIEDEDENLSEEQVRQNRSTRRRTARIPVDSDSSYESSDAASGSSELSSASSYKDLVANASTNHPDGPHSQQVPTLGDAGFDPGSNSVLQHDMTRLQQHEATTDQDVCHTFWRLPLPIRLGTFDSMSRSQVEDVRQEMQLMQSYLDMMIRRFSAQ